MKVDEILIQYNSNYDKYIVHYTKKRKIFFVELPKSMEKFAGTKCFEKHKVISNIVEASSMEEMKHKLREITEFSYKYKAETLSKSGRKWILKKHLTLTKHQTVIMQYLKTMFVLQTFVIVVKPGIYALTIRIIGH